MVPTGISHISSRLQKYNQGSGWKEQRTNERYGLVQLKCKRVKLWHCIPYRLTLAGISSENSTNHEECWLILTGLPSLLLDPISCRLVSSVSGVDCQLPLSVACRQLPPLGSFVQLYWRSLAYFRSRRDLVSKPFVWFRAKIDKGIVCLADHLHSVT